MHYVIHVPEIDKSKAGVYAIIFDERCVYIGSSQNIALRVSGWVTAINNFDSMKRTLSNAIQSVLSFCTYVRFEVKEYTDNSIKRFEREDFHIAESKSNPEYELVLNVRIKNVPDVEKIWLALPEIRKDGRLYFPTKRGFYGSFKPIGSDYPLALD